MSIEKETQRIPAALWKSLQDVCYQQDVKFLQDVSRIIGVPAQDLKRRILHARGEPTIVLVDKDPWWIETQCASMVLGNGNLWCQCSNPAESNTFCWDHRRFQEGKRKDLRHIGDPYFQTLPKRWPVRFDKNIVWVDANGTVLDRFGSRVPNLTIDRTTGIAHIEESKQEVHRIE